MNFIEFLTEITWQHTGETNPQGKPRYRPKPDQTLRTPRNPRTKTPRTDPMQANQQEPAVDPQSDADLQPFIKAASGNRQQAIQLITLLGSIYQAKRRNPSVQLADTPKMANTPLLVQLFKAAKDKDLPQLAAMSQQIKKAATVDPNKAQAPVGANPALTGGQPQAQQPQQQAAGQEKPQAQQGSTPAQQTQLQQLLDIINKTGPNLTTRQIKQASKALNDKLRKAAPPAPNPNAPKPNSGAVINTG